MKLVIDEKLKHRLIGLAVIISLGAIFAPAIMKKSNQNFENHYSMQVKLPPKPTAPAVAVSDEKELFKTIKVAKIVLPKVNEQSKPPELTKAETVRSNAVDTHEAATLKKPDFKNEIVTTSLNKVAVNKANQVLTVAAPPISKPIKKPAIVAAPKKAIVPVKVAAKAKSKLVLQSKSDIYAVQLASFSQLKNAQILVSKLHSKGYKANFIKVNGSSGVVYKVCAGHSTDKGQVVRLKNQLATAMQLNGFVVNTGVS